MIVGLGNPGKNYINTRHNIGYMVIDEFARNKNIKIDNKKFNSLYAKVKIDGNDLILVKPETYMNLSGEAIIKFINFYKIDKNDILIVYDDMDLNIGKYRLRSKGSSAGHNGIKNIILNLNTENFKRLKIGISKDKEIDTKNYVLSKFKNEQLEQLKPVLEITNKILEDFIEKDFDTLMNKYNHK